MKNLMLIPALVLGVASLALSPIASATTWRPALISHPVHTVGYVAGGAVKNAGYLVTNTGKWVGTGVHKVVKGTVYGTKKVVYTVTGKPHYVHHYHHYYYH